MEVIMGSTNKETAEGKAWRGLLGPLVKGLVGLVAAAAVWFQSQTNSDTKNDTKNLQEEVAVLKERVGNTEKNVVSLDAKMDKVIDLISDIRVDVARMAGRDGTSTSSGR